MSFEGLPQDLVGVDYRLAEEGEPGPHIGGVKRMGSGVSVDFESTGEAAGSSGMAAARAVLIEAVKDYMAAGNPGTYDVLELEGHLYVVGTQRVVDTEGRVERFVSPMDATVSCSYRDVPFHDALVDLTGRINEASGHKIGLLAPPPAHFGRGEGYEFEFECRDQPARQALSRLLEVNERPLEWDLIWPPLPGSGYNIMVDFR